MLHCAFRIDKRNRPTFMKQQQNLELSEFSSDLSGKKNSVVKYPPKQREEESTDPRRPIAFADFDRVCDLPGQFFGNCKMSEPTFDACVKDGINGLRPYFGSGLPEYGISSFDPFFALEVPQKVGGALVNYKLILRNVTEAGWTQSQITRFKSDFNKNYIQLVHFFPDKRLNGHYEFSGNIFGTKINTKGTWNLALFDYIQTMTVSRKPRSDQYGRKVYDTPLKVTVNLQSCKNLELHISNLLGGRSLAEGLLDRVINTAWQPGFVMLKPLINDLVGTAFTEILNKNFQYFPFDQLFTE